MDAVAAFVFGSGGAVSVAELQRFFAQQPAVERAFLAAAAPVRQLKKIVVHFGAPYGLAWDDAGPRVVHTPTDAQRRSFPATVPQRIPRALDAMAAVLRAAPGCRLAVNEIPRAVLAACPEDAAFMRARCGSVTAFVKTYDAHATRIGGNDVALWLVDGDADADAAAGKTKAHWASQGSTAQQCSTTASESTSGDVDAEGDEVDTESAVVVDAAHDGEDAEGAVAVVPPQIGLRALRVVWAVLAQLHVPRARTSRPASELVFQVWCLVVRSHTENSAKSHVTRPTGLAPAESDVARSGFPLPRLSAPQPEQQREREKHEPQQRLQRRLLVPSGSHGLTWTFVRVPNATTAGGA